MKQEDLPCLPNKKGKEKKEKRGSQPGLLRDVLNFPCCYWGSIPPQPRQLNIWSHFAEESPRFEAAFYLTLCPDHKRLQDCLLHSCQKQSNGTSSVEAWADRMLSLLRECPKCVHSLNIPSWGGPSVSPRFLKWETINRESRIAVANQGFLWEKASISNEVRRDW